MQALEYLRDYAFAQQALVAGVAVASLCSLLSVVVVVKRMAFIGQGISHAGFGGVGTAVLLGLTGLAQDAVIFVFCLATALLIGVMGRRRRIEPDSAIGIVLVAGMAWGVFAGQLRGVLLDYSWYAETFGTTGRLPAYEMLLFGSLLNVSATQMWLAVVVAAVSLAICAAVFKELAFFAFDETSSAVFGVPTRLIHNLLLVVLAVALVLGFRLLGVIMASALLVLPGATALLVCRTLGRTLLVSLATGVFSVVLGLLMSLQLGDVAAGPCIVLMLCLCFTAAYGWRWLCQRPPARRAA